MSALSQKPQFVLISISLLCLVFIGQPTALAKSSSSCDRDWVCVEMDTSGPGVDLYLINKGGAPVAVTVATRTRNYASPSPRVFLRTLDVGERLFAASYSPANNNYSSRFRYWFDWAIGDHKAQHDDSYIYRLPYASGKQYRVLQGFNSRFSHTGREQYAVDFNMPVGTPVHSAREGVVADVEKSHSRGCWESGCGDYANFIVILHNDGTTGEYYHLQKNGAIVAPGDYIRRGQLIGYSGNTGHTTMPHLHFAVYRPVEWGKTQSLPFRFGSTTGVIRRPRSGDKYRATTIGKTE